MRKPIQIKIELVGDALYTVALCNDGTIWLFDGFSVDWIQLPPIPQPVEDLPPAEDIPV